MSQQYPGGLITKNPVVPSGPYQNSTASGVWTLDQAAQYKKADNWPTAGNVQLYIEDVFSTYLYTGNGSTQTITNGIDLSTKGGLVWMKGRSGATDHALYDTARGATKDLVSNSSAAETTQATGLTAFSGTGFSIGAFAKLNTNAATYASWAFREQAKFFDIVTYTGDGSASPRQIAHSLGSVPGFIVIKRTDTTSDWTVWHRSVAGNAFLQTNDAWQAGFTRITTPDSTTFTVGASIMVNASGGTYVAYLFAHDAGGFGLSGTDNVISCGSYTYAGGANPVITLGWEPQWILRKRSDSTSNWELVDNMRGLSASTTASPQPALQANLSAAESSTSMYMLPRATGFEDANAATGATYIYIAIRRGPMKVPTSGTSVFQSSTYTGNAITPRIISGLTNNPDLILNMMRNPSSSGRTPFGFTWFDRLRGRGQRLNSSDTAVESSLSPPTEGPNFYSYFVDVVSGESNYSPAEYVTETFSRAPGFMDEVCYTGTGANRTISHNLAAVPELIIVKGRNIVAPWEVYCGALANTQYLVLNTTAAVATGATRWNSTTPTSAVFSLGTSTQLNTNGSTYVAYLFATCPGVSKVGSYTGTGATQVINCGFTAGARLVIIKRTSSTGDWYIWDSARGIVAGNDPYLLLNSTAAEVTNTDYIDTAASGFEISSTAPAAINASGGSFIFLAIA